MPCWGREQNVKATGNRRDNGSQMMKRNQEITGNENTKVREQGGAERSKTENLQQPPHSHQNLLDNKITVEL